MTSSFVFLLVFYRPWWPCSDYFMELKITQVLSHTIIILNHVTPSKTKSSENKFLKILPFLQSRCVNMTSIDAEISEDKTGKINSCCRCKIVISPKIIIWFHLNVTMCATESVTLRKEDLRPADPPFAAIGAGCTFATSRICGTS